MEYISSIIKDNFGLAEDVEKSASSLADLARGVIEQTSYFRTKDSSHSLLETEKKGHVEVPKEIAFD